ncbi:hypothetical protein [Colwellia sp. BRX9-1]|uniref:hypothetical protein n=1 Tax=Colwellia sp. BRX9-1 TaxID=2759830 RepID=UPI0015F5D4CD|nr:hypothetical protein [Colwellia sp. BRX9-1]MBA6354216.1 hypothetical protein [Colwellia sp. BRX9-1]
MSIRYLSESENYKVYSLDESVYLKDKSNSKKISDYEERDELITWVYGNPDSALLSWDEKFVVVGGCGITIYLIESKECIDLFNEPNDITWTEGVYQAAGDDIHFVRFNVLTNTDKLQVVKLNIKTQEFEVLS